MLTKICKPQVTIRNMLALHLLASETLSAVTELKIGDICLFIYACVDIRMYVILYFDRHVFMFALWSTLSHTPPLNGIFSFSDPVSFKGTNYLSLCIRLFLNATRCT